jgi:hypothetical protein
VTIIGSAVRMKTVVVVIMGRIEILGGWERVERGLGLSERLLSVEHHLVISPLSELGIVRVKIM